MKREDLFEMATLDALGLLEPEERRVFEDIFRDASPALQHEIRREQRRVTDIERSLPAVEPPASLRGRVLAAVLDAMTAMNPARAGDVLARIGATEWVTVRRQVSPLWRAACIGFATATIGLVGVGFHLGNLRDAAWRDSYDRDLTQLITQDLGAEFVNRLLDPFSQKVSFVPAADGFNARATILIDPDTRTAYLVTQDFPVTFGEYRLVIVNDAGEIERSVATFTASGKLSGTLLNGVIEPGSPLAIVPPAVPAEKPKPVLLSL